MSITERISAIESEREKFNAECDAKLSELKKEAMQELVSARDRVAALEKVLNVSRPSPVETKKDPSPYAGTDFAMGIGAEEPEVTAQDFRDELAALRARSVERRRIRQGG